MHPHGLMQAPTSSHCRKFYPAGNARATRVQALSSCSRLQIAPQQVFAHHSTRDTPTALKALIPP